jgi:adenylate cyclase
LQPEQVTLLLNEYFTEMSAIATKHGGTIDKFIGDAMLIFFGDPDTKGEIGDAEACLRMAWEMQLRLRELNVVWHNSGVEQPFQARMGINSGYCNVGNFGSADRMDYTIIGAEANLAARLQSVAEAGRIVLSYETYALVRHLVTARALPPITMKGISREVVPYAVERLIDAEAIDVHVVAEETAGLSLYLDPGAIQAGDVEKVKSTLSRALAAMEQVQVKPA